MPPLIFSAGLVCNEAVSCRASHAVLHLGRCVSGLLSSSPSLSLATLWSFCRTWSAQKPLPNGILMPPAHLELKDEMRPKGKGSFFLQLLQPATASQVFFSQPQGCFFLVSHYRQVQTLEYFNSDVRTVVSAHDKPFVCLKKKTKQNKKIKLQGIPESCCNSRCYEVLIDCPIHPSHRRS